MFARDGMSLRPRPIALAQATMTDRVALACPHLAKGSSAISRKADGARHRHRDNRKKTPRCGLDTGATVLTRRRRLAAAP